MQCHIDLWFVDFQSIMWLQKIGLSIFKYFLKVILDDLGRVWHIINSPWNPLESTDGRVVVRKTHLKLWALQRKHQAEIRWIQSPKVGASPAKKCLVQVQTFRGDRCAATGLWQFACGMGQNHSKPIVPNMLYVVFDEHPWKSATQKGDHKGFGGFWCIAMQPYIFVHLPQYWISLLKDIHIYSNHMVEKHDTSKNPTWIDESKGVSKMSFEWIWEIPVFLKTQTTEPTNWSWWSSAVI